MNIGKVFSAVFVFLFIGLVPCYARGQQNGDRNVITQERTAINFNGIKLEGVANINIHFGDTYKVTVSTDSNLQEFVTTTVNDNLLYINTKDKMKPSKGIQIDVYMPEIKSVNLKGVGNITFDNGNGLNMEIIVSGVGNIDAQNYHIEEVNINQSGVGNIKVWADKINGTMSGVGNLQYKDSPIMNFSRSGVGEIRKL